MRKTCAFCGKEFETPNCAKYCTENCACLGGLENRHNYYQEHREGLLELKRQTYKNHTEEYKERNRKYHEAHIEERKQYLHRYHQNHHEKCLEYRRLRQKNHGQEVREHYRQYYATAHGGSKIRAKYHNRRVRLSGISMTADTVLELKSEYGGICPYCNARIVKGHIDHIAPVSKGGTNDRNNLVWACSTCNVQKHNRSLLEFMMYRMNADIAEAIRQGYVPGMRLAMNARGREIVVHEEAIP